jgi:hypothetical protein
MLVCLVGTFHGNKIYIARWLNFLREKKNKNRIEMLVCLVGTFHGNRIDDSVVEFFWEKRKNNSYPAFLYHWAGLVIVGKLFYCWKRKRKPYYYYTPQSRRPSKALVVFPCLVRSVFSDHPVRNGFFRFLTDSTRFVVGLELVKRQRTKIVGRINPCFNIS